MIFFIGLAAGAFGALAGLGGGVVMIPLLAGLYRLEQHAAHGSSLVALIFTGIASAAVYYRNDAADLLAAAALAVGAVFMVRLGVKSAQAMPDWQLKKEFGGLLCCVALMLLVKSFTLSALFYPDLPVKMVILLAAGALTGFFSGMFGVGGGFIMVPVLTLLAGYDQHTAQGSSLLAMIPVGALAAYTHWRIGQVNEKILPWLIPGVVVGSLGGAYLAHSLPELYLRLIFSAVLLLTGLKYFNAAEPKITNKFS
jgi:hypothetical protein